jgi:hypothetical protein
MAPDWQGEQNSISGRARQWAKRPKRALNRLNAKNRFGVSHQYRVTGVEVERPFSPATVARLATKFTLLVAGSVRVFTATA